MADLYRSDIVKVDINKSLNRMYVGCVLATGDNKANRFGANVYRGGEPVALDSCGVTGYFIRQNMETVVVKGVADGNTAYVDLEQACYSHEGQFSLAIKVSSDGVVHTVRIVDGYIRLTQTDVLIDPGDVIPSLDNIFAQLRAMDQATDLANAAANFAKQAATTANNATQNMMQTAAPVIIQSADGDGIVAVSDSAERTLSGMHVYGITVIAGTPTPEAPVPMVSVANGGSIGVQVCGKNLFDLSKLWIGNNVQCETNGNSVHISTNSANTYSGCRVPAITMHAGIEYVLSAEVSDIVSGTPSLGFRDANSMKYIKRAYVSDGRIVLTYTPTETIRAYAYLLVTGNTASDGDATFANIQLEVGASATPYEPFKDGGSMTAVTPNGLPGIPVSSGGNYIDKSGQQWVCDEIDFTRKVLVKRCGEIASYNGESIPGAYLSSTGTLSNGASVIYALETPVETPLSPEELTGSTSLTAQYPITTVFNDSASWLKMDYIADTKIYIDQRIAALMNA